VTYAKMQNVSATDKLLGRSTAGAGDVEEITCTAAGRALIDDADASAQRTTLGLVIGTNVQAQDAELAAIAGLTSAADRLPYFTGSGTAALATFTSAGRALIDDADAAAQRTTLGATTVGGNVFTLTNPSAITFVKIAADNSVTAESASTHRTSLGLGTVATLTSDTDGTLAANSDSNVATQKAVKTYVDTIAAGMRWKQPVRVATTANGTLATAFENGDTVDGVTLATGDRILLKDQSTGAENGIYIVAASGAPARATDADSGAELVSAAVFVQEGTANADRAYVCTNNSITLGSTAVVFVTFNSAIGSLLASNNLSDLASASTARTNLGVAIGANVQAWDATLDALASLTIAANTLTIGTGADAFSQTTFAANTFPARASSGSLVAKTITDFGLSLVDDADAAAGRATLGATTVGGGLFTLTNPSAVRFIRVNADNSVSALDASTFLTAIGGGAGTVTTVSVATANGVSGSVATATTTPAITLTLGDITPSSVVATTLDSATNGITVVTTARHNSSGTPAAGFGLADEVYLQSSTTANQAAARDEITWATATHVSRKARRVCIVYGGITAYECVRMEAGAAAAMVGFLGASAVVQQTGDAGTALVTFGLMSGTPTFASGNLTGTTTNQLILLQDQKTQNTAGGTFTSGAWQTRTLNTEVVDTGGNCSLSSNQFTLSAGTYRIRAWAPGAQCDRHQIRLQNVTAGTTLITGKSSFTAATGNNDQNDAYLSGRFTVAASQALEIQHRGNTTANTVGFGVAANFTTEIYTHVEIEKEAT
jgi:hypothetical protein